MEENELEKLRYPIGRFSIPDVVSESDLKSYIAEIEEFPGRLRILVQGFNKEQFETAYRENGWKVKQVVHHAADSHINAFIRFKLALTEDTPTVKAYYEDKFAELGDYKDTAVEVSLNLLEALHIRWIALMRSMSLSDFERTFFHPENGMEFSLAETAALYSWHCRHHYAHIEDLKKRMKW